ncbi:hypothetical protein SCORR_v1c03610 [Spiroplasma corruscae]|uniref:Uncharacterized protein n=1 Tax=Spiroplasma corruscae TaxID=216934 RepID=A0A222ENQ6_9MOLU|nr:hypothetical protein [Spiroplasma corruscae]ASP28135.1 hypothetical protein SCORR_v1c03610 [Spiroplasma corruscae]
MKKIRNNRSLLNSLIFIFLLSYAFTTFITRLSYFYSLFYNLLSLNLSLMLLLILFISIFIIVEMIIITKKINLISSNTDILNIKRYYQANKNFKTLKNFIIVSSLILTIKLIIIFSNVKFFKNYDYLLLVVVFSLIFLMNFLSIICSIFYNKILKNKSIYIQNNSYIEDDLLYIFDYYEYINDYSFIKTNLIKSNLIVIFLINSRNCIEIIINSIFTKTLNKIKKASSPPISLD